MGNPVVHFEIIGTDPAALRDYYGALFGWQYNVGDATTDAVSDRGQYGFAETDPTAEFPGIPGGVAGGPTFERRVLVYVGVPNVAEALDQAERLGGSSLAGYFVLNCETSERATEIASRLPDALLTGIELRSII